MLRRRQSGEPVANTTSSLPTSSPRTSSDGTAVVVDPHTPSRSWGLLLAPALVLLGLVLVLQRTRSDPALASKTNPPRAYLHVQPADPTPPRRSASADSSPATATAHHRSEGHSEGRKALQPDLGAAHNNQASARSASGSGHTLEMDALKTAAHAITHPPARVVVVGGGLAGLTAALEAAGALKASGGEVVVVEKMPKVGGNSMKVGGQWPVARCRTGAGGEGGCGQGVPRH